MLLKMSLLESHLEQEMLQDVSHKSHLEQEMLQGVSGRAEILQDVSGRGAWSKNCFKMSLGT